MGCRSLSKVKICAVAIASLSVISGCASLRPKWKDCSDLLSAPKEGMRADIMTSDEDAMQAVEVRLNGVSAQCHSKKGKIYMAVDAGLKLKRQLDEGIEPARVQVPFLISLLDENDQPYDVQSIAFKMAFPKNVDTLYPVSEFELDLKQGARAVIALTPKPVEIN